MKEDALKFVLKFLNQSGKAINHVMRHLSIKDAEKHALKSFAPLFVDKDQKHYCKIDDEFRTNLLAFSQCLDDAEPLEEDLVVWRGCSSLKGDGLSGIVSTTKSLDIAKSFDRGTIIKIIIPKGAKVFDVGKMFPDVESVNGTQEVILPPCNFKILKEVEAKSNHAENPSGRTKCVSVKVSPKNLLREFAIALQNMPEDYFKEYPSKEDQEEFLKTVAGIHQLGAGMIAFAIPKSGNKEKDYSLVNSFYNLDGSFDRHPRLTHETNMLKWFTALNENKLILPENQLSPDEFFNSLLVSKHFDVLKEYLFTDDHKKYFEDSDGFHDLNHADNCTLFAYYLAEQYGLSEIGLRLTLEAVRFHDAGRYVGEEGHAKLGAVLYKDITKKCLPDYESDFVADLILTHENEDLAETEKLFREKLPQLQNEEIQSIMLVAKIIKDADTLDHVLYGVDSKEFDPKMLHLERSADLISVAKVLNMLQGKNPKLQVMERQDEEQKEEDKSAETENAPAEEEEEEFKFLRAILERISINDPE